MEKFAQKFTNDKRSALVFALISFVCTLLLSVLIGNRLAFALMRLLGFNLGIFYVIFGFVCGVAGFILSYYIYNKFIAKSYAAIKAIIPTALIASAVCAVVSWLIDFDVLRELVEIVVLMFFALQLIKKGQLPVVAIKLPKEADGAQQAEQTAQTAQTAQVVAAPVQQERPEDMDGMCAALLGAIRPSLKAPLTAQLCEPEQMQITCVNGEYTVEGVVHSQNSYGAMIATDFTAKLQYTNGVWVVLSTKIGVKNAKAYAKTFASNYIAISIFVGVMGLLGYFILTMIVG